MWFTMQESCFAPFIFDTDIYSCFASEDWRSPRHCPVTSGEISLSSFMLYEPDLERELHALHLQELFTMMLFVN